MAHTHLVTDKILLKCLQVLHAKCNFIGSINRNYDSEFAQQGAKIGESLRIRLPESFTVGDGPGLALQDSTEQSTTLAFAKHKTVNMAFTQRDMTLSMDDFAERKIIPAMSAMASTVEADALSMVLDVYNMVGTPGSTPSAMLVWGQARAKLNQYLAPQDKRRIALMDSLTSAVMSDGIKALFEDSNEIGMAFREGVIKKGAGFTWAENDLVPVLTTGTRLHTDACVLSANVSNGATSMTISTLTGAATIAKGEVFTFAGVYAVHPETKSSYSHLQQFVVTAAATMSGGAGTVYFSPACYYTGAYQNVSTQPLSAGGVDWGAAEGGSGAASTAYQQNITYHKDAFAFVTADFEPLEGCKCERKELDGISMMLSRGGDITNFRTISRLDVLYGYKTVRPQLACRVTK